MTSRDNKKSTEKEVQVINNLKDAANLEIISNLEYLGEVKSSEPNLGHMPYLGVIGISNETQAQMTYEQEAIYELQRKATELGADYVVAQKKIGSWPTLHLEGMAYKIKR